MAVTYARSAQTRVVTLLNQIVTPTEWNPEKSTKVLQMCHHNGIIGSNSSASSSHSAQEKIVSSIKITLALQNVCGPLANALSLRVYEKSTWNDTHTLLINYFNNSIPSDSKEIYQFDISGKVSRGEVKGTIKRKDKVKRQRSMDHMVKSILVIESRSR